VTLTAGSEALTVNRISVRAGNYFAITDPNRCVGARLEARRTCVFRVLFSAPGERGRELSDTVLVETTARNLEDSVTARPDRTSQALASIGGPPVAAVRRRRDQPHPCRASGSLAVTTLPLCAASVAEARSRPAFAEHSSRPRPATPRAPVLKRSTTRDTGTSGTAGKLAPRCLPPGIETRPARSTVAAMQPVKSAARRSIIWP